MKPNPRLGEHLDTLIWGRVQRLLRDHKNGVPLPEVDFWTDNFGEMLDKLIVLHIRVWHSEDMMGQAYDDDAKMAEIKKKMDILWKRKRPSLVAAINRLVDDAIVHGKSLVEDSFKNYKGFEDEPKPRAVSEFTKEERGK